MLGDVIEGVVQLDRVGRADVDGVEAIPDHLKTRLSGSGRSRSFENFEKFENASGVAWSARRARQTKLLLPGEKGEDGEK